MAPLPEYLTVVEAARMLGCRPPTAKKLLGNPDAELRFNRRGQLSIWLTDRVWALIEERAKGNLAGEPQRKRRIHRRHPQS